jgi:hypothetical protein
MANRRSRLPNAMQAGRATVLVPAAVLANATTKSAARAASAPALAPVRVADISSRPAAFHSLLYENDVSSLRTSSDVCWLEIDESRFGPPSRATTLGGRYWIWSRVLVGLLVSRYKNEKLRVVAQIGLVMAPSVSIIVACLTNIGVVLSYGIFGKPLFQKGVSVPLTLLLFPWFYRFSLFLWNLQRTSLPKGVSVPPISATTVPLIS